MIAFTLAVLLWQGTFAQPQLDGRYGVDRVAFEKAAQQAADETNGKCKACGKDAQGKDYCVPAECPSKPKPSPQITAVRAELRPWGDWPTVFSTNKVDCEKDGGHWIGVPYCAWPHSNQAYACPSDSDLGPFENRKGEHWCLKIEEAK